MGKYIYGVIKSGIEEFFDLAGIGALESACRLAESTDVACEIEVPARAYTVLFRDISAVVSDSEALDYTQIPKHTLARLLLRHQEVIEKIMARHTIIPMKLGTCVNDAGEVKNILAKGYRTIKNVFERAQNSIEIDVVATLNDFSSFLLQVSQEDAIQQLKQSLLNNEQGITTDDRIKIGILLKQHIDRKRKEYACRIEAALGESAQSVKAHDLMNDAMVSNAAFLVDRGRQHSFEQQVAKLNASFEEKLNFRCVGPLPAYSFYTLEVKRARFEEIDWAKKQLGIVDGLVTANDIKKAHHRSALACHPDKNPDTPGIEKKFDDMTRAYKILLDYYRASNPVEDVDGCCLDEGAVEQNAVLVTTAD